MEQDDGDDPPVVPRQPPGVRFTLQPDVVEVVGVELLHAVIVVVRMRHTRNTARAKSRLIDANAFKLIALPSASRR